MAKRKYYRIGKKRFLKANVRKNFKRITECLYIGLIIGFILTIRIDGQVVEAEALKQAETATQVSLEEVGNKAQIVESPQISMTVEEQIRDIATEECYKRGLGDYCVEDTLAIAWVESRFNCNANGDSGKSFGCFQIYIKAHPDISPELAKDIVFSTKWTIDNLINHGYPEYRSYAIRRHNGDPTINQTLVYLEKVNNYLK